jgi:CBS domain-containing protein
MNKLTESDFRKRLLDDLSQLDNLIKDNAFSKSRARIGAEQEVVLMDKLGSVSPISTQVLKNINHPQFNKELAKFNIELNLTPRNLESTCFVDMKAELQALLSILDQELIEFHADYFLTGIFPNFRLLDLDTDNITPDRRFFELVKRINVLRSNEYELRIQGIDELSMRHDSVFIEAAATSFQIHLEVAPKDFSRFYNIAQLIAGPCLAMATNSLVLFRKKLWHETRIALLRQSIQVSKTPNSLRDANARVTFGNHWIQDGILELFREDVSLHRSLIVPDIDFNKKNEQNPSIPLLKALQNYNSTIYRWNRPVYGILDGEPHLRIENRIFPAGPSLEDQMANTVFWYGLMFGFYHADIEIEKLIDFDAVKNNFLQAARNGLNANFEWFEKTNFTAQKIVLEILLPIAKRGLDHLKIDSATVQHNLSIIERRVETMQNGSNWTLQAIKNLEKNGIPPQDIYPTIVSFAHHYQQKNLPIHQWDIPSKNANMKRNPSEMIIEEYMDKDLFTVSPSDPLQLASDMIDWQKIRFILVENEHGELVGLVSSRTLLKNLNLHLFHQNELPESIEDIMVRTPITIDSNKKLSEALEIMEKYKIGCLPVLQNKKLVGIVTEQTFLHVFSRIID